jgi:tyrosinase
MARFTSNPLDLPPAGERAFVRADLIFYGVAHRDESYEGRVFIDQPTADVTTPRASESGYAGSFTVFGHGGCFGDRGHCDPDGRTTDEFDVRPPHPMTRWTKVVIATDAIRRAAGDTITVTVVPVAVGDDAPRISDAMRFESLRLALYGD